MCVCAQESERERAYIRIPKRHKGERFQKGPAYKVGGTQWLAAVRLRLDGWMRVKSQYPNPILTRERTRTEGREGHPPAPAPARFLHKRASSAARLLCRCHVRSTTACSLPPDFNVRSRSVCFMDAVHSYPEFFGAPFA